MKYNFCFLPNLVLYRSLSQMMYYLPHRRPLVCSICGSHTDKFVLFDSKFCSLFLSISVQENGGISCLKITHESLRKEKNQKMEYGIFFTYKHKKNLLRYLRRESVFYMTKKRKIIIINELQARSNLSLVQFNSLLLKSIQIL